MLDDENELVNLDEDVNEIDKKERKRKEKEERKAEKLKLKEEKREQRKIRNAELKQRIVFILKVIVTSLIVTFTGFLNSICVSLLGFTKLAILFIVPSIFLIPGLFIPLIWVGKGNKGIFFTLWLICVLTYIIGLALPTLLVEYNTISLAFIAFFEWLGGLFV